jgi:hypothetical protein
VLVSGQIHKEYRPIAAQAVAAGWTISFTKNNHLRWTSPSGKVVFSGGSPSDRRALYNHVMMLRRNGLEISR